MAKERKKEYARLRGDSGQRRRIFAASVLLGVVGFVPVAIRLCQLMITDYGYYAELALRNQTRTTLVSTSRGTIYDRNMNVLACNQSVHTVYLNPHELKQSGADLNEISRMLADLLEKDPQWIMQQGKDLTKRYKQIAARVDEDTAAQIRSYINERDIRGIHLEPGAQRYYMLSIHSWLSKYQRTVFSMPSSN